MVSVRERAHLTQRHLAQKLRRERSLVGRLELGERRLDVVEFYWVCKACNVDPEKEARALMRHLKGADSASG
jgi:transcriptional regulator with XRE-family HTH domain